MSVGLFEGQRLVVQDNVTYQRLEDSVTDLSF